MKGGPLFLGACAAAAALAGAARAQVSCDSYTGATAAPQAFADAVAPLRDITPKDEFETTAAYEARIAQAVSGAGAPLVIAKQAEELDFFPYDADAGRLEIQTYAFDNRRFDAWDAIFLADQGRSVTALSVSMIDNMDAVVAQTETPTGSYRAENAFGVDADVLTVARQTAVIFEGPADSYSEDLFPGTDGSVLGALPLTPDEARQLKPQLHLAFVVTPKPPYLLTSTITGDPTLTTPVDLTETFSILIADFHCALVLDAQNTVLAAYPTN